MCDNDRIRRSTAVVILFDLVIVSEIPAEEKMVVSNGGSSCGCSCLADRPCKMLLECKLAMEEVADVILNSGVVTENIVMGEEV